MSASVGEPHDPLRATRRCPPCRPLPEDRVLLTNGSFLMPKASPAISAHHNGGPACERSGLRALHCPPPTLPGQTSRAQLEHDLTAGVERPVRQTGGGGCPSRRQLAWAGRPVYPHSRDPPPTCSLRASRPALLPLLPTRVSAADPCSSHGPSPSRCPLLSAQLKGQGTLLHAPSTPACLISLHSAKS